MRQDGRTLGALPLPVHVVNVSSAPLCYTTHIRPPPSLPVLLEPPTVHARIEHTCGFRLHCLAALLAFCRLALRCPSLVQRHTSVGIHTVEHLWTRMRTIAGIDKNSVNHFMEVPCATAASLPLVCCN